MLFQCMNIHIYSYIYTCIYIYHILFFHSPDYKHLDCSIFYYEAHTPGREVCLWACGVAWGQCDDARLPIPGLVGCPWTAAEPQWTVTLVLGLLPLRFATDSSSRSENAASSLMAAQSGKYYFWHYRTRQYYLWQYGNGWGALGNSWKSVFERRNRKSARRSWYRAWKEKHVLVRRSESKTLHCASDVPKSQDHYSRWSNERSWFWVRAYRSICAWCSFGKPNEYRDLSSLLSIAPHR